MKERPILFSAPMVRAILDGRKTMTRRVIKLKDLTRHPDGDKWYKERVWSWRVRSGSWTDHTHDSLLSLCPHGQPGDRLWVREAFQTLEDFAVKDAVYYRADGETVTALVEGEEIDLSKSWRPSIFMPRWASRILLEVTAVRIERVQDITPRDCIAEGCEGGHGAIPGYNYSALPKEHFRDLWDSLNAKRGAGWGANPWIWVIEFKRINSKAEGGEG